MVTQGEEIASDTGPKMYVWRPAAGRSCSPPPTTGGAVGAGPTNTSAAGHHGSSIRPSARTLRPEKVAEREKNHTEAATPATATCGGRKNSHYIAAAT